GGPVGEGVGGVRGAGGEGRPAGGGAEEEEEGQRVIASRRLLVPPPLWGRSRRSTRVGGEASRFGMLLPPSLALPRKGGGDQKVIPRSAGLPSRARRSAGSGGRCGSTSASRGPARAGAAASRANHARPPGRPPPGSRRRRSPRS